MKKQIVLNTDDIRQTIANSLNVGKDKVMLECTYEKTVPVVIAVVEVPINEQR